MHAQLTSGTGDMAPCTQPNSASRCAHRQTHNATAHSSAQATQLLLELPMSLCSGILPRDRSLCPGLLQQLAHGGPCLSLGSLSVAQPVSMKPCLDTVAVSTLQCRAAAQQKV
jgi:hypothetical protein